MKKKLTILAIVVIIVAAFVVAAIGFNVDLKYRAHETIVVPIGESYNMEDAKKIVNEVFGNKEVVLEKSGLYDDELTIRIADVSDEQLANLKNKFNEKYNIVQNVYVLIGDSYAAEDVQAIAKEVFGKEDVKVEKESEDEKYAQIEADLLTEKDIEILNDKLNEKFAISNSADSIVGSNIIKTNNIPRVKLADMAMQYLLFTVIATVLVYAYYLIRYRKLGFKDVIQDSITVLAFAEALYMAIIGIVRIPINKLVFMVAFAIYIAVLTYLNVKYEKTLEKQKSK